MSGYVGRNSTHARHGRPACPPARGGDGGGECCGRARCQPLHDFASTLPGPSHHRSPRARQHRCPDSAGILCVAPFLSPKISCSRGTSPGGACRGTSVGTQPMQDTGGQRAHQHVVEPRRRRMLWKSSMPTVARFREYPARPLASSVSAGSVTPLSGARSAGRPLGS